MKFTALVAVIQDSNEEEAIKIAKEAGAGSVTILHGKNIGLKEKKVFFGLTLEENVLCPPFHPAKKDSLLPL